MPTSWRRTAQARRRSASVPSGEKGEHPQGMLPDIPLGMEDRRLVDSPEGQNLGQDLGKEAAFGKELHAPPRPAARQDPGELLPDPLGADPPDGGACLRMAAKVAGSIAKPSVAAKRTARSIRR